MPNIFKNTRFMMGLSIVCGIASLVLGGISLYYKEYIIGGALIFNIFICFINYKGWQKWIVQSHSHRPSRLGELAM